MFRNFYRFLSYFIVRQRKFFSLFYKNYTRVFSMEAAAEEIERIAEKTPPGNVKM
jgi:hypothetical protein